MSSPDATKLLMELLVAFRRNPGMNTKESRGIVAELEAKLRPSPKPPAIVFSGCLCGRKVTFRGGSSHVDGASNVAFLQQLGPLFRVVPYCPEMEWMGLPAPRDPIRMVGSPSAYQVEFSNGNNAKVVEDDRWESMVQQSRVWLAQECVVGAVLKARSPSCGVGDGRIYLHNGKSTGSHLVDPKGMKYVAADGVWVEKVVKPHLTGLMVADGQLPLVTERSLRCDHVLRRFLHSVAAIVF